MLPVVVGDRRLSGLGQVVPLCQQYRVICYELRWVESSQLGRRGGVGCEWLSGDELQEELAWCRVAAEGRDEKVRT